MPRSQRRVDADSGYADGHIFVPIPGTPFITGSGATQTTSFNGITTATAASLPTTATAYVATVPLNAFLFRYGLQDDIQMAFGAGGLGGVPFGSGGLAAANVSTTCSTTAGPSNVAVSLTVNNSAIFAVGNEVQIDTGASAEFQVITAIADATHITVGQLAKAHTASYTITQNPFTTAAGASGPPPFTGITELTPLIAPRPKGILFKAIYPVFSILGATATVNTIGIISTTFANAAATSTKTILAVAANGMPTAVNSANQAYVTNIALTGPNQVFQTTRFTEFVLQWNHTTGTGGSAALFGVFFDVTYNFN